MMVMQERKISTVHLELSWSVNRSVSMADLSDQRHSSRRKAVNAMAIKLQMAVKIMVF